MIIEGEKDKVVIEGNMCEGWEESILVDMDIPGCSMPLIRLIEEHTDIVFSQIPHPRIRVTVERLSEPEENEKPV